MTSSDSLLCLFCGKQHKATGEFDSLPGGVGRVVRWDRVFHVAGLGLTHLLCFKQAMGAVLQNSLLAETAAGILTDEDPRVCSICNKREPLGSYTNCEQRIYSDSSLVKNRFFPGLVHRMCIDFYVLGVSRNLGLDIDPLIGILMSEQQERDNEDASH